jgi:hypothetical protein
VLTYGQLILDKDAKAIQWKKTFSTNNAETMEYYVQKLDLSAYFMLYTKINSTWIKDLKVRTKSIKLIADT